MMTITEMIEKLEEIKKEVGDVKVYIEEENDYASIQGVAIGESKTQKYVIIY